MCHMVCFQSLLAVVISVVHIIAVALDSAP